MDRDEIIQKECNMLLSLRRTSWGEAKTTIGEAQQPAAPDKKVLKIPQSIVIEAIKTLHL